MVNKMEIVNYVLLAFALAAAIDRIFGSRLGIGKDFERGISIDRKSVV